MNIGNRISEIRKFKNIKAVDLAKQLKVTTVFLSYIEHGTRNPTLDMIEKIAHALNVTVSELIGETQSELTPDEKELLSMLQKLEPKQIEAVKTMIKSYL